MSDEVDDCQDTALQAAEKLQSLMVLSGHGFIRAAKLLKTCWGFTGCGKTPDFWLVRSSKRIFRRFGLIGRSFLSLFCVWRAIFRPPDT
ncbi:MAG: hypothetical protein P4M01_01415, partial [Acidobacteriota bacterium]|nr:hypothetical protein [Acidobacteriota bacterium]